MFLRVMLFHFMFLCIMFSISMYLNFYINLLLNAAALQHSATIEGLQFFDPWDWSQLSNRSFNDAGCGLHLCHSDLAVVSRDDSGDAP